MDRAPSLVDRLSALLEYPGAAFSSTLADCRAALATMRPEAAVDLERFAGGISGLPIDRLQELYVETFDLNPRCTLDIGWHLFGEAYERGAFLATMRRELQRAGIAEAQELPDHLPSLLMLMDRMDPSLADELRRRIEPGVETLGAALEACHSPYAHLVKSAVAAASPGG